MLSRFYAHPTPRQATAELGLSAVLWGFGFIAARWALDGFGAFSITALRFTVAVALTAPLLFLPGFRQRLSLGLLKATFLPGVFIAATLLLQTEGLRYTSVTKSGFITCLYVVFIPVFEAFFLRVRMPVGQWFFTALSLMGAALMCGFEAGHWNWGDLLTLGCAVTAAIHILWLGHIARADHPPFAFNFFQSLWAAFLAWMVTLPFESVTAWRPSALPLLGILSLALGSTVLAFFIQVRCQKILRPSVVSLLFLLESPFAALFAYLFFRETLGASQAVGAALILGSALGTIRLASVSPRAVV